MNFIDTFFILLKKGLVATVFIVFAFVFTYVPQPYNHVEVAEAGPVATEFTQIANNIQLAAVNIATTATSIATGSLWIKENLLDGIAWTIAKGLISSLTGSLIDWINSGFSGSPAFVQDLRDFLVAQTDVAIGNYIADLGAIGSFLCDPFRLDVQIAVALEYDLYRVGQPAPIADCSLGGILDNVGAFTSGDFTQGGWDDWIDITSNPNLYTPYGAQLTALEGARTQILNTENDETNTINNGGGFLSGEVCFNVTSPSGPRQKCVISTPGKTIQEALSFGLDSGRQSLVAADEFNEILVALLSQLANSAITGASGLLGLTPGTGQTYSGYGPGGFTGGLGTGTGSGPSSALPAMQDARDTQQDYATLASTYIPQLNAFIADPNITTAQRNTAINARNDALAIQTQASTNVTDINNLISQYTAATGDPDLQNSIVQQFNALLPSLYTQSNIAQSRSSWDAILNSTNVINTPVTPPTSTCPTC